MWSNLTACRRDHMIGRQSLRSRRRFTPGISEVAVPLDAAAVMAECQVTRGLMTLCRSWSSVFRCHHRLPLRLGRACGAADEDIENGLGHAFNFRFSDAPARERAIHRTVAI